MTTEQLWMLVRDGGVVGALTLMVWALVTGRVVPRWVYDDVAQQRDRAISVAEAMGNALDRQRSSGHQ